MKDYCVGYSCNVVPEWEVTGIACVCVENALWTDAKDKLKVYDSRFHSHLDSSNTEGVRTLKRLF